MQHEQNKGVTNLHSEIIPRILPIALLLFALLLGWLPAQSVRLDTNFAPLLLSKATEVDVVEQPDGKLIYFGKFTYGDGTPAPGIVRMNADNTRDTGFDPGTGASGTIYDVKIQSDGKLIVAGSLSQFNGVTSRGLVRLNADGSLDTSFQLPTSTTLSTLHKVVIQSDGKIIVAGDFGTFIGVGSSLRYNIARLNTDGSFDASFDAGSLIDSKVTVKGLALQADGKVLVAGTGYYSQYLVESTESNIVRLNPNGTRDATFSSRFYDRNINALNVMHLNPDGTILIGGDFVTNDNASQYSKKYLLRMTSDGNIDSGFPLNSNTGSNSGPSGPVSDIAVQADGSLIFVGKFFNFNEQPPEYARRFIARVSSTFSFDYGFTPALAFRSNSSAKMEKVHVQTDGKCVVIGNFVSAGGSTRDGIARFTHTGALDEDFDKTFQTRGVASSITGIPGSTAVAVTGEFDSVGPLRRAKVAKIDANGSADPGFQISERGSLTYTYNTIQALADGKFLLGGDFDLTGTKFDLARLNADGSTDTTLTAQPNSTVRGIATQQDGKIIIVGNFTRVLSTNIRGIARLNPDGSIDTTFNPGEGATGITEVAIQTDGKILIAGNFGSYNTVPRLRVARLNSDGSLDTGFNPGSGANSDIYSLTIALDGGIYIGGRFTTYDETERRYVARLNPDGSLDDSFDAGTALNNAVNCVKGFGGKLLVGGQFSSVLGSSRGRFARLNLDGSVDDTLSIGIPSSIVHDISVDKYGGILLAGEFTNVDGVSRVGAARLELLSPVVTSPVELVYLDEGAPAILSVSVVGEGPFTYQWKRNGSDLDGETGATLEIASAGAGNVGEYSVTVTNTHGSATNVTAILSLNAPPTIAQQPSNLSIARNTTAALSVNATGVGTLSYQWYRGAAGDTTNPVGTDSSSFTSATLSGDAQFWIAVTNAYGTVNSQTATVTVGDPPTITSQPTPTGAIAGGSATFEVQTSGTAPFSYQWKKNGSNAANGTSRILALSDVDQNTVGDYSVVVTNSFGSVTSDSAAFTIHTPPYIVTSPTSRSVVSGSNVTFEVVAGGDGPLSYTWRLNGNLLSGESSPTLTLTNVQQSQAGSYQVTVSNSYGTTSRTANLTINEPPSINSQPSDRFVTSGSAATLSISATGSGTLSYQWYQGAQGDFSSPVGGNSSNYTTPALSAATVYHVVVASQYGTVSSRTVTVHVGSAPSISTHPVSTVVAAGADASFSVSATGDAPLSYQWFKGEDPVAGGNGSTLLIQQTEAVDAGTYKVRVSNNFGDVTSSTATLSINSPPIISQAPTSQTAAAGDNVIFTVQASGSAPLTYQWRRNLMDLPGENGTSLSLTGVGMANEGDYTVVVTNAFGTATGGPAVLTVNSPPTIQTQPANKSLPRGNATMLSVEANGTAPFSYQWYKGVSGNTSEPVGADQATFETPFLNATTSYWVRVTNSFGFSNSNTATLTVGDPPAISSQPLSQTVSNGFNIDLSVSHTGTGPFTYAWKKGTANLEETSSTLSLQGVTETDEGSYTVTVTNAFGTATSNPAVITVNSPPEITNQPGDVLSAEGGQAVFQVVASGDATLEYQWKVGDSPIPGATGASLSISPVTLGNAGTYTVTVSNAYGTATSSGATLTVSAPPAITSSPGSRSVPSGSGATLSVTATGSNPLNYQWYMGNFGDTSTPVGGDSSILNTGGLNETTTFWVRVTNDYGSADSAPATISVGNPPAIVTNPAPQSIPVGDSVTFSVAASGTAQLNYMWMKNGDVIPEATSTDYFIPAVSADDAGNYSVSVSNQFGSVTSSVATLAVVSPPTISQQPQPVMVAAGGNAFFAVSADGSPPLHYQWKKDGDDIAGQTGTTLNITGAEASDEGDYSVSVSNAAGTVTSSDAALMVNSPPLISGQPLDRTIQTGQQTTLSIYVTGSGPLVYQWYLGESGDTSHPVGIDSFQYITPPLGQSSSYWASVSNPFGFAESETARVTISNPIPQINSPSVASGRVGALFSFLVSASGIPDSFAASGLPEGLNINPATGIISGVPEEAGEFEVSLEATNENGTGQAMLTLTISEALPTITSAPAANGSTTRPLSYQITATNSPTSYSATGLPSGLSLNPSTGLISGTPAAAVEKDIQVGASNAGGNAFLIVHLTILSTDQPPVMTGASHFAGQVDSFFQHQLTASNSPSSFTATGLPPGLSLSQVSGLITGTPQQAGTFAATFTATNGNGTSAAVEKTFVISPAPDAPVILPFIVPRLHQGSPVGIDISASNNPTLFSASGLPIGISINSVTGRISGTPTSPGTYSVALTAANSGGTSRPYTLPMEVRPPRQTPVIMNSSSVAGRLTVSFSLQLAASRNPSEYRAPNLPSGLSLNPSTGLITGTPLVIGVSEVEVSAMNEDGWGAPVTMTFRIIAAPTAPVVQPGVNLSQRVGETFRHNIFATENPTLYSASGLPPGLTLDPATGLIGGVGTRTGIYAVLVTAENALGTSAPEILTITIIAPLGTSEITSSLKVRGELGVAFSYTPNANQEPISFSVSGLPPGLSFDGTTISGVPTLSGGFSVILSASSRKGAGTPAIMQLTIDPGTVVPAITSSPGLIATQNQPFSYQITATNGPITSYGAENLPPGVSIDPATGVISGTPLAAGRFEVELLASNTNGTGKLAASLAIKPAATAPVIFSKTYVSAYAGDPFSYQIKATGSPDTFRATELPSWVSINTSTGLISGTTGPTGSYSFTIQAENEAGLSLPLVVSLNSSSLRSFSRIDGPVSVQGYVNEVLYIKPVYSGLEPGSNYIDAVVDDVRWWQYYNEWEYEESRWRTLPILTGTTGFTTHIYNSDGRHGDARRIQVTVLSRHDDLRITSPGTIYATAGQATEYRFTSAAGNATGYNITHLSAYPTGITLDEATGVLAGIPDSPGTYSLVARAKRGLEIGPSREISLVVNPAPGTPNITESPVKSQGLFAPLAFAKAREIAYAPPNLSATGHVGQPFSYILGSTAAAKAFEADSLPDGLLINPTTGEIAGTPTLAGVFPVPVRAVNAAGYGADAVLQITILAASGTPEITSFSSASAQVGVPFSYNINADASPLGYNATGLPAWLSLDDTTGTITGTPTKPGTFQITISATNTEGTGNPAVLALTVTPSTGAPEISSVALATGSVGSNFNFQLTASNAPDRFEADILPPGLSLDNLTGLITGTPLETGNFIVNVAAVNTSGTGGKSVMEIHIAAASGSPAITSAASYSAREGVPFSFTITANNDPSSFNSSNLPLGMAFDGVTGILSGTPEQSGDFVITFSANNSVGTGTPQEISLQVLTSIGSFTDWASDLPVGKQGALDDPFSSGSANLVRFALGMESLEMARDRLPRFEMVQENDMKYPSIVFIRPVASDGITFSLQGGENLSDLTLVNSTLFILDQPYPGFERVRLRQNSALDGNSVWFLRLRVVESAD